MEALDLSRIRLDAFKEITSIATGNAAASLSKMLGMRVDVTVPNVSIEALEKVPELLGGPERMVTVVYFTLTGRISGTILLMLPPSEALSLASALTRRPADQPEDLDEMAVSALKELGNIITGTYVGVFGRGLGVKVTYSVPGFTTDMLGAVLDETLARMSVEADCGVVLESEFIVRSNVHRGYLVFVVPLETVKTIVGALGTGPETDDRNGEEPVNQGRAITILLVEDSNFAAARTESMLREIKGPQFDSKIVRATQLADGLQQLAHTEINVVLLDLTLPDSSELETFSRVHNHAPDVPVVVLSGLEDENLAIEAVRKGAEDYLIKGEVTGGLLKRSILYAIERKRVQRELAMYRQQLEDLVDARTAELRQANECLGKEVEARKTAQKDLAQKVVELDGANKDLEHFVKLAAHDLLHPLRTVSIHTELLQRRYGGSIDPDADELINNVLAGTKRMYGLVNGLLVYAEIARSPSRQAPIALEAVVADAVARLRPLIDSNDATVSIGPMPVLKVDRQMIARLFSSLIENAIRFRGDESPRVHVSAELDGSEWVFSVRDNGIGIDPKYHNRIFGMFQQLNRAENGGHPGIGLAVCRRIVEQHNGKIWVDPRPNQGAVFHFTLPMSMEAPCPSR